MYLVRISFALRTPLYRFTLVSDPLGSVFAILRTPANDVREGRHDPERIPYYRPRQQAFASLCKRLQQPVCNTFSSFQGAKVLLFFDIRKYFLKFNTFSYDIVHLTFRRNDVKYIIDKHFAY